MKTIDEQIEEIKEQMVDLQKKLQSLEDTKHCRFIEKWVYFRSTDSNRYLGRVVDVNHDNGNDVSFTCSPLYRILYEGNDISYICKYKEETKYVDSFDIDRDLVDGEELMLLLKKISDFANDND